MNVNDNILREEFVNLANKNRVNFKKLNKERPVKVVKHEKGLTPGTKRALMQLLLGVVIAGVIAGASALSYDPDTMIDHTGYIIRTSENNVGRGK